MAEEWFAPRVIRFTRRQCLWLIRNLGSLRAGYWPSDASSYIDIPSGKKSGSARAYFETPIQYAAEIEMRLEAAGIDGLILLAMECWDISEASLAKYFRKPEWSIRKSYKRALKYVAGWRRKK